MNLSLIIETKELKRKIEIIYRFHNLKYKFISWKIKNIKKLEQAWAIKSNHFPYYLLLGYKGERKKSTY